MKWFRKKKFKEIVKPEPPKLEDYDYFIIIASLIISFIGLVLGGVVLATGMLVGLGFVIAIMIVLLKFKIIRNFIFKRSKWIDAGALFIGLILSTTSFAMLTATFAGIFLSAFLSIYGYILKKREYEENIAKWNKYNLARG